MQSSAHQSLRADEALRPEAKTATGNGLTVTKSQDAEEALVVLQIGAVTGTTPTLDVKMQDSPDNSVWTDITGATMAQKTASHANKIYVGRVNWKHKAKHLRAVFTIGGTTPSFTVAAAIIQGAAGTLPTAQANTNEFSV